jgi:transcriptional regulator with XRE-family HTH domain
MEDLAEQVGSRIRTIRVAKHLSQEGLAERINVTRPYISRLERGRFNMRLDTMAEICKGLGVQPGELFGGVTIDLD